VNLTPLKKGAKIIPAKVTSTKINPAKVTFTKITPTKIALAKIALIKITPTKGKGKGKECEANIELDYTIETITLIAAELSIYYKEAYYIGRYTLIITNNLLVNLY
jgi:hypothetical protein